MAVDLTTVEEGGRYSMLRDSIQRTPGAMSSRRSGVKGASAGSSGGALIWLRSMACGLPSRP
ncbi:hypothetical protein D3C81_1929040 [compost metagenome]